MRILFCGYLVAVVGVGCYQAGIPTVVYATPYDTIHIKRNLSEYVLVKCQWVKCNNGAMTQITTEAQSALVWCASLVILVMTQSDLKMWLYLGLVNLNTYVFV